MADDAKRDDDQRHAGSEPKDEDLSDLLSETRILLPGTEILLAFLVSLPFTDRFERLSGTERFVYVATFLATVLAFVSFVAPSAYHRIARPIQDKPRFKRFSNVFLVFGLVPVSISVVLVGYLVISMAAGQRLALPVAVTIAVVVGILWWVVPLLRTHARVARSD